MDIFLLQELKGKLSQVFYESSSNKQESNGGSRLSDTLQSIKLKS